VGARERASKKERMFVCKREISRLSVCLGDREIKTERQKQRKFVLGVCMCRVRVFGIVRCSQKQSHTSYKYDQHVGHEEERW
jgi:hypothetical protein